MYKTTGPALLARDFSEHLGEEIRSAAFQAMAAREVNFVAEYAKTNRSSCSQSNATIPAGALRIGRNSPRSTDIFHPRPHLPSPFHDGYVTKWYLPDPFFKKYGREICSAAQFVGLDLLRPEDQTKLRTLAGEKLIETKPVPEIEALWVVKDGLRNATLKEIKADLQLNGVSTQGGQETLAQRLAEGLVFGKATCSTCATPDLCQLKYQDGIFKCETELQWGVCSYEGTEVTIHPWKRSPEFVANHPFLSKILTTPIPRPLKKVTRKIETYNRDPKRPLRGMKFAIIGDVGIPRDEFASHIQKHGGVFVPAISTPEIDYVVTTYPTLIGNRPSIQKSKEFNLAFVTPLLVDRLISEFGFDQTPYLLDGTLPQIAYAKLEKSSTGNSKTVASEQESFPAKKTIHAEAKAPNGKIYVKDNIAYDVIMTMTDIKDSSNKYYILQIIDYQGDGKSFVVFRKWGRVGTSVGGTLVSPVSGFNTALQIFKEVYVDKTGFEWENREKGEKQPRKYFPLSLDNSDEPEENSLVDDSIPSYLDPKVRDLVEMIFDVDMMTREVQSLEVDVRKMPLGKLTQSQITKGYEVLGQIEKLLNSGQPSETQIVALSNQFYTIIPTDFGNNKVQMIDSFETLTSKMKQLAALLDVQIASSLLKEETLVGIHPTDQKYKRLGVVLQPLSDFSREFKTINKYIENSYDPAKVGYTIKLDTVFSVSRPGEKDEFSHFKMLRPRKLLWHGSRLCNYVGILNQGLRIAPPEAPTTGYLFGKGIYFADRISKSAPFCLPSKDNPIGLLLLSDVALGEHYELKKPQFVESLPPGKHSTLVLAKQAPDPKKVEFWFGAEKIRVFSPDREDKVVVPNGPPIATNLHDVFVEDQEYVVYQRQLMIRYLVKVKFVF